MELITFHGFVPGPSKVKLWQETEIRLDIDLRYVNTLS